MQSPVGMTDSNRKHMAVYISIHIDIHVKMSNNKRKMFTVL